MKTHLFVSPEPILTWPEEIEALCKVPIKNPKPVLTLDSHSGSLESESTLMFCKECGLIAIAIRTPRRRWVYGVKSAQEAHEANLRNRTDD